MALTAEAERRTRELWDALNEAGESIRTAKYAAEEHLQEIVDAMYDCLRKCEKCQGLVIDCINRCPACRALLKVL